MAALVKTAETMGILDTYSDGAKQADIDEILGFLASLEKVGWLKLFTRLEIGNKEKNSYYSFYSILVNSWKIFSLKVLPSEKDLKRSLMNNAIYNEYTVDELQASFGYVSSFFD